MASRHLVPDPPASGMRVHPVCNAGTYSIFDLARRFGQYHRSPLWMVRYLQDLITTYDFPRSFPVRHAGSITDRVTKDSRWPQPAVDQWFHDRLPPDAAAAADAAAMAIAADVMDARAGNLALRLVQGGRR